MQTCTIQSHCITAPWSEIAPSMILYRFLILPCDLRDTRRQISLPVDVLQSLHVWFVLRLTCWLVSRLQSLCLRKMETSLSETRAPPLATMFWAAFGRMGRCTLRSYEWFSVPKRCVWLSIHMQHVGKYLLSKLFIREQYQTLTDSLRSRILGHYKHKQLEVVNSGLRKKLRAFNIGQQQLV